MKTFWKVGPSLLIQTQALLLFGLWVYCSLVKGDPMGAESPEDGFEPFRFKGGAEDAGAE
jgi:hypothetical protein